MSPEAPTAKDRRTPRPAPRASARPFSLAVFLAAAAAGAAGHWLPGAVGLGAAALIALLGAVVAGLVSASRAQSTAPRLPVVPSDELARERDRASKAVEQLEKAKRHAEIASLQFREGKDPLTEIPELRVGPLRELLEAARVGVTMPVMSRLSMSEEDLVAADGEPLPVPWPKDADEPPPGRDQAPVSRAAERAAARAEGEAAPVPNIEARADMVREMDALIEGLGELATGLSGPRAEVADGTGRTPAQLVDAVVHTAADGIEDLAAGLMRANELAGVAERVTNKATLLALNAALEATRSGSEAFAAIAEETRRLAEFAREATDTISRLSSEIEYKVGETITAIHATSEDAKSAVATFQNVPGDPGPRIEPVRIERLLRRAQQLKRRIVAEAA